MVLISDVSEEACKTKLKEGVLERAGADGVVDSSGGSGVVGARDSENAAAGMETAELAAVDASPPVESSLKEADMAPGKPLYNDYARRVAYAMRSYLHMRPRLVVGTVSTGEPSCGEGDRCSALMEVVRKENGRWCVSKVVLEHAHSLSPPPDLAGTVAGGRLIPAAGMEFDSISIAKAFYCTYSEKIGFKARTGSGRRSKGDRILVMQRFLCSKGNYPPFGNSTDGCTEKKKRGPYKNRNSKLGDDSNVDVTAGTLETTSTMEKAGIVEDEMFVEGHNVVSDGAIMNEKDDGKLFSSSESDLGKQVVVGTDAAKLLLTGNPAQSRLLREFGIRVSRYTHEERRDIIRRYMRKRSNRQVVDRSAKVPSRQALAERRQRGFGGKFLSKEETEMQAINKQHETVDEDPELPAEVVAKAGGVPIVGMGFDSEEKAYEYYVRYAASIGFSVRKGWWDKAAKNVTRSRLYVCSREGFRPKNAIEVKKSRPEIRTGCPARMAIKISSGRYRVIEFVPDHNHQLAAPLDIQILKSQKLLSIGQRGYHRNGDLIPAGYKNYIRAKRVWNMKVGDSGTILQYMQKMKVCNPSFYYAIQVDEDDKMTNIFWADAKSVTEYRYFGDVICLNRPYKIDDFGRPLALFLGVNHHKQTVIFGSAFLYNETPESFKWLFEAFKTAMGGKQPKTIFIDQFLEIDDVIEAVWPGTAQRLCTWQIYQHAFKHLVEYFQATDSFEHDFSQCIFDFEEEEEFLDAWAIMLEKYSLKENEWLSDIYNKKEKWAPAFGRDIFCADMQTTMRLECLNNILKEWLNQDVDVSHFFKHYERLLEEKRYAELQADYHSNQGTPRIPPLRMLWQAANVYTPAVFEVFRREFELFMNCAVYSCGEVGTLSEHEVTFKGKSKAYFVRFDSFQGTAICSCKKFFFVGIQCCHVLKVLDFRNVKELPQNYVLKRWRKDAKVGSARENQVLVLDEDSKSSIRNRYKSLCRMLYRTAERAAENIDAFTLLVGQSNQLIEQVERALQTKLLDKPSHSNAMKGQLETKISFDDNNSDAVKIVGKKRKEAVTRRQQRILEVNKRNKTCKGQVEHCEVPAGDIEPPPLPSSDDIPQTRSSSNPFVAPSHFMQGPYITGHQFSLPTTQGFHSMTQFSQVAVPGYPTPEMHALQFIGSNAQLDHQGSDQGHCNIPVWDFL